MSHPEILRSAPHPDQGRAILDRFETDGFAVVPGLFSPTEVAEVRATIDQLFSDYRELPPGHGYDLDRRADGGGVGKIPGIRDTLGLRPHLRETKGLASAVAWAERVAGSGSEVLWDAAIYKPSGSSSETPWHQDAAVYPLKRQKMPRSLVYFWVALDEVDDSCGCIRFVPGSHRRPLLPHGWRNNDTTSSLEVLTPVEAEDAVTVSLGAGDATIHHPGTLHGSGPNVSERCRKAWVLGVGRPKAPRWVRSLKRYVPGWGG